MQPENEQLTQQTINQTGAQPPDEQPPTSSKHWIKYAIIGSVVLIVVIAAVVAYLVMRSSDEKQSAAPKTRIKVGILESLSDGSSYGILKGIQLAKKQLGADNIELIQEDSECDKEVAPGAMQKLIDRGAVAIIGDGCSAASLAALPKANASKVIMISPTSSSPKLSISDDYFFRVIPSDNMQGSFLAKTVYEKGLKTAAVFYSDEPYGASLNEVFTKTYEEAGGKVVASVSAETESIDLDKQVQAIKAAAPQAVFIAPNTVVSVTAALNKLYEAGVTAPVYCSDICYDASIAKNASIAAEGLTVTSFPTGTAKFKKDLVDEFRTTEQLFGAAQAYDAFQAIYLATTKGSLTGEAIKNSLATLEFDGASGRIAFDKNGEISSSSYAYTLLHFENGALVEE